MSRPFLMMYAAASIAILLAIGLMCPSLFEGPRHESILFSTSDTSDLERHQPVSLPDQSGPRQVAVTLIDFDDAADEGLGHDDPPIDAADHLIDVEKDLHAPPVASPQNATFLNQSMPTFPIEREQQSSEGEGARVAQTQSPHLPATGRLPHKTARIIDTKKYRKPDSYFSLASAGAGSQGKSSGMREFLLNERRPSVNLFHFLLKS